MLNHYRKFLYLGLLFAVIGCTHNPQPLGKPLPTLTYDHLNSYSIHGGSVRVQQSFRPDEAMQALAAEFPIEPEKLVQRYANKRFVTGMDNPHKLVFDIQNAALSKLSDKENMVSFLAGSAEDVYVLDIFIAMTPVRADGQRAAPFTVKVQRQLIMSQNISLAEREFRQFEMLEQAMFDVDQVVSDMVVNKMRPEYF